MSLYVDIEKKLGNFLLKVKLEAGEETLALLGGSGCGKSMTLKCIAGIERPDRGRIVVDDEILFDSEKKIDRSPQKRRTGLMFQNYALFPQMTVRQNLAAGARRETDKAERSRMVQRCLEEFGLKELADRLPSQLSGGQQQRVALARILVSSPRILLLDEPFSALDAHLRFRMENEVRDMIRAFGKTVVFVSHDRDEVFRLSDRIAIMENGRIDVIGPRHEVFHDPRTVAGARLTGCKNVSPFTRDPADPASGHADGWGLPLTFSRPVPDDITHVGIRMHDIYAQGDRPQVPSFPDEKAPEADSGSAGRPDVTDGPFPSAATSEPSLSAVTGPSRSAPAAAVCRCRVTAELEDPFQMTVMLRPEGAPDTSEPLGWVLPKEVWAAKRAPEVTVVIPEDAVLLLREG